MTQPHPLPPDLSTPELRFLHALWTAWQTLAAQGEASLRSEHGLDLRGFIALSYLQMQAQQPNALARELNVPRYEMSRILGALEDAGLIERHQAGGDGRRVSIQITSAGRELWHAALLSIQSSTGPAIQTLSDAQQQDVITALHQVAASSYPSTTQGEKP